MDQRHHHTTLVDGTEQVTVEDCALGVVVHEVARVAEDELEDADSDNETCYDDPKCCSHSLKARFLRAGCLLSRCHNYYKVSSSEAYASMLELPSVNLL